MKRFAIVLDDETFAAFWKAFPYPGLRTTVLRKCIQRLIQKAKEKGSVWDPEIEEITDKLIRSG